MGIAFDDFDIAIDGKTCKTLDETAGLWPFNLKPIHFFAFAETENDARVVRGKIAAAADFHAASF